MNQETIQIKLSQDDRDLLLKQAIVPDHIADKLRFGVREGKFLVYNLGRPEAEDLADCIAAAEVHAVNRKLRRQFARLSDRIEDTLAKHAPQVQEEPFLNMVGVPNEIRDELHKTIKSNEHSSLDEIKAAVDRVAHAYNTKPQEGFNGLSPTQMHYLMGSEWDSNSPGIRCHENLTCDDLAESDMFYNARLFLSTLNEENGTKATTAGNLNRKFVNAMAEQMRHPDGFLDDLWRYNKVINEQDVRVLHYLRIVIDAAGLIKKQKGAFQITKKGASMLSDDKAGQLYALIFRTFFTRFNLAYMDRMDELLRLQADLPFTFYVIGQRAQDWVECQELAECAFHPQIAHDLQPEVFEDIYINIPLLALRTRVLKPLEWFGLVQLQVPDSKHRLDSFLETPRARITPLFNKFIEFHLPNE